MSIDQRWKETIDNGLKDPARNQHRATVTAEVNDYNNRLKATAGYQHVDFKMIEAVVWVESGGPKTAAWNGRAMQIGNAGDPGLSALKNEEGATAIIVAPTLLTEIQQATATQLGDPAFNIKAGIAYLFVRMAQSKIESIETSPLVYEYEVQAGDSLAAIARRKQTTISAIDKATQEKGGAFDTDHIVPGQHIYYREAYDGRAITGWRSFTIKQIALRYNSETTDPNYSEKLRYVYDRF